MATKEMTATDAIGLAQRAALDAWAFMSMTDERAALVLVERVEDAARGLLGWCRVKRQELGATRARRER